MERGTTKKPLKRTKVKETSQQDKIILKAIQSPYSAIRSLTKNNLFYFIQYFWSTYSQEQFVSNWHIKYICEELEKGARRVANNQPKEYDLIINVPPGSSKTAVVSIFFPLWCWVNWYYLKFITASYTAPLSLEIADYSRRVLKSEKFQRIFPEIGIKLDNDNKSNFRVAKREWVNTGQAPRVHTGGNRFSTSVTGTVTGFHGHINIVDDPIDPMRVISEVEIKKANHWMTNSLPMRKVDKKVTLTILIMQRLHQNDPTAHLLNQKGAKIKHICLPGEIRNYRDKVQPPELVKHYKNDLLDVNRLDWGSLKDIQALGQFTYGGQIGQAPVPLGGGMFHTDHLSVTDRIPVDIHIAETVRYWDKAGTKDAGAYTVGLKMCKLKDGTFIVLDVKRGQWASNEREKIIKETAKADGEGCKIFVEQEPGSGGKESAEATVRNLAGFSVRKDLPRGDKAQRADPYSVQVNDGNVRMLNAGWNKDYVEELKNFPNSTFKDQTDASSGAFSKLTALKVAGVLRRR